MHVETSSMGVLAGLWEAMYYRSPKIVLKSPIKPQGMSIAGSVLVNLLRRFILVT